MPTAFTLMLLLVGADAARLSREEYEKKARAYRNSHTKADLMVRFDHMTEQRGHRMWEYFQEQLDDGRVSFDSDDLSHVKFLLPPSHAFSLVTDAVHPIIADGIETLFWVGRALYYGVLKSMPSKVQTHHDDLFHSLFETFGKSVYAECAGFELHTPVRAVSLS